MATGGGRNKQCGGAIGVGSFAFRYAVGFSGFAPANPMRTRDFIVAAHALGVDTIQLCENLRYADEPRESLRQCAEIAKSLGLRVEIGMQGLDRDNVLRHLELCELFDSPFLRLVIGGAAAAPERRVERCAAMLSDLLPEVRGAGVRVGIENHFDLTTPEIVAVIERVGSPLVGAVFDTTNAIGFIEKPRETLALLAPHLLSVHIKDYRIRKAEASYVMTGEVLGRGQLGDASLIRDVLGRRPEVNFILEMTVRRREGIDAETAIAEERGQIEASLLRLREIFRKEEAVC